MSETKPDAFAVMNAAIEKTTLDEFMRRDPAALDAGDMTDMVELLQRARARSIKLEIEKKSKKEK